MNRKILNNNSGFSVIEVLISLAMAAIIITAIGSSLSSIHKLNTASADKEKALAYAKQSMEIVNDIKEKTNCCFDGSNYFDNIWTAYQHGSPALKLVDIGGGGQWQLQPGSENIDNFTREISLASLCRDTNGNVLETCGAQSPDGKTVKITVTINWNGQQKASLSTIFTNWRNQ